MGIVGPGHRREDRPAPPRHPGRGHGEGTPRSPSTQTGHNSGVVHAGIYYAPGSLKADLCVRGVSILREYCQDRGQPYEEIGKLVVAVRPDELGRMENLYERARNNHVPELRKISQEEIKELEPHVGGIAALHSPRTAITDYPAIAREFAKDIEASGGEVRLGFPVTSITNVPGGIEVASGQERVRVDRLILCAGLHSDAVAKLAQDKKAPKIIPFRGEYMLLKPDRTHLVRGLIYPVPDPRYPLPRRALHPAGRRQRRGRPERRPRPGQGGLQARPHLPEGPRRTRRVPRLLADGRPALADRHQGVPRFAVRVGLHEGREALRPRCRRRRRRTRRAGVRAQALDPDGTLVDDFRIHQVGRITAVRNAPSPAATASMAIAEHIVGAVFGASSAN
ncbi:FAD-dependent oxidoreductase [Streptomyces sp. L7]